MRHYDLLDEQTRDGFRIVIDKTYDEVDPWDQLSECFDSRTKLYDDIDSGKYDWFMLRVRVLLDHLEMGSAYLGGCLYEDAKDVLTDGTAEDLIFEAMKEAKEYIKVLKEKLESIEV